MPPRIAPHQIPPNLQLQIESDPKGLYLHIESAPLGLSLCSTKRARRHWTKRLSTFLPGRPLQLQSEVHHPVGKIAA